MMNRPILLAAAALLVAAVSVPLALNGARRPAGGKSGAAEGPKVFRIGYQKGGALQLLRVNGDLDRRLAAQGVKVEWLQFTAAPPMLEAIGVNSLDMGSGGDAPVVFAQAAGYPIALIANTPPGDNNARGVLVANDSPIRTTADLKGKRIAISKGTGTHNYLIQVLDRAGVPYSAIKPVYLAPPDARAAFDAGRIDAWAAWDPFLTVARKATGARCIANGEGVVTAGGFYYSSRDFARKHPEWIRAALEEVDKAGIYLWKHPHEAAVALSPHMGVDAATLEAMNRNAQRGEKHVGFRPVDAQVIAAQQTISDNFYRIHLIPKRVDVKETLLTPAEYAALLPSGSIVKVAERKQ